MDNKNELMKNCLDLVRTLVEKTNFGPNGMSFYDSADRSKLNAIIDYSFKKTVELSKRFDTELPMQVYCEDLVVLSIDDKAPVRYFLTDFYYYYTENGKKEIDIEHGNTPTYVMVDAKKEPWCNLLGAHVGDSITYTTDEDKGEHKIEILSTRRTKDSINVKSYDINCSKATNEEMKRNK